MAHEDDDISDAPLTPGENKKMRIIIRDYERLSWIGKKIFFFFILLPGALWAGWQFLKDVMHLDKLK